MKTAKPQPKRAQWVIIGISALVIPLFYSHLQRTAKEALNRAVVQPSIRFLERRQVEKLQGLAEGTAEQVSALHTGSLAEVIQERMAEAVRIAEESRGAYEQLKQKQPATLEASKETEPRDDLDAMRQAQAVHQANVERRRQAALREEMARAERARQLEWQAELQRQQAQQQQLWAAQQEQEAHRRAQEQAAYERRRHEYQMRQRIGSLGY